MSRSSLFRSPAVPRSALLAGALALAAGALAGCDDTAAPDPVETDKTEAAQTETTKTEKPGHDAHKPGHHAHKPGHHEAKPAPDAPEPTPLPADANPALTDPTLANKTAPDTYKARFVTSEGSFVIEVHRDWAPNGADRFYNLIDIGFFDNTRFFRNVPGFMVQWGMSAYPAATQAWQKATIMDDPVKESNQPLMVTFAKTGRPNSRSTQIFINHGDNKRLDDMGFAPFGKVVEGADVVGKLYGGYGDGPPGGRGPRQDIITNFGNIYLETEFPKLSVIQSTEIL